GDGRVHPFQGGLGVCDAARIVAGGDAVLGDEYRDVSSYLAGTADPQFGRRRVELPAGQGALHFVADRDRSLGTDEVAGVGLDPDEVVPAGLFQVPEIARVAVLLQLLLTARLTGGLEGLSGDGPPGV